MMANTADIALSSRVRLARNLREYRFAGNMSGGQQAELVDKVNGVINANHDFMLMRMRELPLRERKLLVERHLISPALAQTEHAAALINREESISIMIGEEDHLRIQCLRPGLNLEQADELSMALDDMFSRKLNYAFDPELGYLTACPTNVGTGMRASVMLHLPALSISGQAEILLKEVSRLGYAVRGIYGEGSSAPGHICQVSNQRTLGMLEEDIISNLKGMVQRLIERERTLREQLYRNNKTQIEDLVYRSCGVLRYARRLNTGEAMEHISNLKLGSGLGVIKEDKQQLLNALLTDVQAASLEKRLGEELNEQQRDEARASIMRELLEEFSAEGLL
jgi:protein arginine kinase